MFVAFDVLVDSRGKALLARPLKQRRRALERFIKEAGEFASFQLSPATTCRDQAVAWLEMTGSGLVGIVAKRLDQATNPAPSPGRVFGQTRPHRGRAHELAEG